MPAISAKQSAQRRELFAQYIVEGMAHITAYQMAGYHGAASHASKLHCNPVVRNRIIELQELRAKALRDAAVANVTVTRETILAELEQARQLALTNIQAAAAVSATLGKAKVMGLIIDKREIGAVGAFETMTDEQLLAEVAQQQKRLGFAKPLQLVEAISDDDEEAAA